MAKRLFCVLLCFAMLISFTGCRYSDVLEQIIYDLQKSQDIDTETSLKTNENNTENKQENDKLNAQKTSDNADNLDQESQENPVSGDQQNNTSAANSNYDSSASASGTASEGTPSNVTGTGSGATASSSSKEGNNGTGTGGTGDSGTSYGDGGADSAKNVVNDDGTTADVPTSVSKIAATGQAALAVLIVSGGKALTATDAVTMSEVQSANAYGGLSDTQVYWSDGYSQISDSDFSTLLAYKPDAVIETSGNGTVTEAQAEQLQAAGISYLAIPQMTSVDSIKQGINAIAEMLKGSSYESDASANAQAYCDWLDNAYNKITSATSSHAGTTNEETGESTSGTYTLYIDGWDSNATYEITNTSLSGQGMAYANNGAVESTVGIRNFLAYANIVDTASLYGISAQTLYVSPLLPDFSQLNITNGIYGDKYYKGSNKLLEQNNYGLGSKYFPYVIVPNSSVKSALEADRDRGNGLWSVYPHINTGNQSFNSDGFLDNSGQIVRTQISGSYEVLVNPHGLMSDWTSGGPEGILESLWAGWKYFNAISEDELRTYISDFYSTFYQISLSAGQIDQILAGSN